MAFQSVLQMYTDWVNSLLWEEGNLIDGLHQLRDGIVLCKIIDTLTYTNTLTQKVKIEDSLTNINLVLEFLKQNEVNLKSSAEAIINGELKSTLDVMWAIILHCTVHKLETPFLNRTVRLGKQNLIEWFNKIVPESAIQLQSNLNQCFCGNNNLALLIEKFVPFTQAKEKKDIFVVNLTNALLAAEDKFGIVKTLIRPSDVIIGNSDEHSLMIYLALLRRKVSFPCQTSDVTISKYLSQQQITKLSSTSHHFKFLTRGQYSRMGTIMNVETEDRDDFGAILAGSFQQDDCLQPVLNASFEHVLPDIKISATRNIEKMLEQRRQDFEIDDEKTDGQLVQNLQRCTVRRLKTPEDELLGVLDAIAKACRHLKKELDESQLRELYLIDELQQKEQESSGSCDVLPKLIDELQVLRNENRRLFREGVIVKTEGTKNKRQVERLQLLIDGLQSEVEHLNVENHRLKLTKDPYLNAFTGLKNPVKNIPEAHNASTNCLNIELELELKRTTEDLKKAKHEVVRLKQEKRLLKMTAETSKLEATTHLNRCQRLENLLIYGENNIGFGRTEKSVVSQEAMAVPDVAVDAKYLELLKKLDKENILLRERLLLAEEDREILREEVRQYRINASASYQHELKYFDLHSSSEGVFIDNQTLDSVSNNQIHDNFGTAETVNQQKRFSKSEATSENTEVPYACSELTSMELLHMKLKTQTRSDTSSSVSGFSITSKDDVFPELPSPIYKSIVSLSSVDDISSIDESQCFNRERKMSLGGLIASNAAKSPPRIEDSLAYKSKKDLISLDLMVDDSYGETTLTQDTLHSPRLALGTRHILRNSEDSINVIDPQFFVFSSTPKPSEVQVTNIGTSSSSSEVVGSEEEFQKLPDQIEDPERLHDTSPKSDYQNEHRLNLFDEPDTKCEGRLPCNEERKQDLFKGVEDTIIEEVIASSGSGLSLNHHSTITRTPMVTRKLSLSPKDQQYANSIIDKYLRLTTVTPE